MPIIGPVARQAVSQRVQLPLVSARVYGNPLFHSSSLISLQSEKSMRGCCYRFFNFLTCWIKKWASCWCLRCNRETAPASLPFSQPPIIRIAEDSRANPRLEPGAEPLASQPPVQELVVAPDVSEEEEIVEISSDLDLFDMESLDEDPEIPPAPMLTLIEAHELMIQMHEELNPNNLQELVMSDNWPNVQLKMDRLYNRLSNRNFEDGSLLEHFGKLTNLMTAAAEWDRYLSDLAAEPLPYIGDIEMLAEGDVVMHLPELLSAVRVEIRKPPEEINRHFIDALRIKLQNMDDDYRTQVLLDALYIAEKVHELHESGFFQRIEHSPLFDPIVERLEQILQELSPERIEAFVNTQRWDTLDEEMEQLFLAIPPHLNNHFSFLYGDRIEAIHFMKRVGNEWAEFLHNPDNVEPYGSDLVVEIDDLQPGERVDLIEQILAAAREQVRNPPESIDLARLTVLEGLSDNFELWQQVDFDNRELPEEFEEIRYIIKLARGLKELHTEGYFQRRLYQDRLTSTKI